jgi:hypothetical protein
VHWYTEFAAGATLILHMLKLVYFTLKHAVLLNKKIYQWLNSKESTGKRYPFDPPNFHGTLSFI